MDGMSLSSEARRSIFWPPATLKTSRGYAGGRGGPPSGRPRPPCHASVAAVILNPSRGRTRGGEGVAVHLLAARGRLASFLVAGGHPQDLPRMRGGRGGPPSGRSRSPCHTSVATTNFTGGGHVSWPLAAAWPTYWPAATSSPRARVRAGHGGPPTGRRRTLCPAR